MPTYEVSSTHYFRENGLKIEAGDTVELTEEQAEANNATHPGLLKLARQTTQKHVDTVRSDEPVRRKRIKK